MRVGVGPSRPGAPVRKRTIIAVLIVLNLMVLLGQIWPEGAPPFAGIVNTVFLVASLLFFVNAFRTAR